MELQRFDRTGRGRARGPLSSLAPAGCIGEQFAPGGLPLYPTLFAGSVRPSGAVPTTGAPAASYPAGNWAFKTNLQVVGADPTINPDAFGAAFAVAAEELAGVNVSRVSIRKLAQTTQSVPRTEGLLQYLPSSSMTNLDVPSWWVEVEGDLSSRNGFETNRLNQAISRAFANGTRWSGYVHEAYRSKIPRDGGQLWARFQASNACTGGATYTDVMARACTRIGAPGAVPAAPPNATPPAPSPAPATPAMVPNSTMPSLPSDCAVRVASPFWLRPRATFEHVGPQYPAGTAVTITGPAQSTQGSLALFPVSVAGVAGYAALSTRDMEGCTTFRHPAASAPATSSRPVAQATLSRPSSTPTPARTTYNASMVPSNSSSSSTWLWGLGAFGVAAVGIGAFVKRKEIKAYFTKPAHGHSHARE